MLTDVPTLDLVAMPEIAEMLGVTKQRVAQLAARPDFPPPAVTLSVGRIWRRGDIRRWADKTGRDLTADKG